MRTPFKSGPDAEAIAIDALAFLASDVERLGRFLALTGLSPETIREVAQTRGFMAAVLDHLASDESLLLAFAANQGLDPANVLRARESLARPHAMGLRDG
ncbi:DUF3572 domain-containing protein [uncultured Alsobacter sp.]|uniref:DUF3572 domain-containing protein n=1 Tax=uncultured Alsobacter sp. TaxID=1748258 RepID=UPI0025F5397E|nr:DUF3572 domain-containing protein [uncultured Alsobacter sp.]